ncbi:MULTISPECIES: monovalent cation:proton antiporter-2 (CPA2) family protein [unclassified Lysobacter]|uniref:monovalent cation:proton antiporter-2 (CPA2) family protein n=1 Tax=unclassified Lysobacter TaxID=2635362 RepID=UPI001BE9B991|nr:MULTISPECIES: monovalent cation:proton antiporter-2 (CPA2) family protein [unclassified Lysobacter]MBT2748195.1 cation:proton antiporter [Lysobacter sp. ISL-42]MBT2753871.1 cation:proton antiporter [Lysobacter sp. ISL-50]MBT2778967.1 cation:proton antiporter [Lysobacter sp. ISL-54]MBT2783818.1 cation:proton antiporter [Lysobacter sp. ISL-52]
MAAEAQGSELVKVVVLLAAGVVAVPIFKRIGLGSVLGYLAAGLLIGPFGLGFFTDSQAILHVAELGVVMFLFIIGLEMRPSHLWSLRREIFGLGTAQIALCSLAMTGVGLTFGLPLMVAFIGAMGFVLTSTAIVMQILGERSDLALPRGQRIVSILLFEDLLIVPLLALVALMAPPEANPSAAAHSRWADIGIALASLATLLAAGIWLLNPLFRVLAAAKAREVMTAAALLVVLGAALLMQIGGLSMAMGAFLAGVLLSESTFRHQLEADIEPFRGILLGLFFLSVGMSLNLTVVAANWPMIVGGVLALMLVKSLCIYIVARLMKSCHTEALDRAVLMAQGGEFAFVLFSAAANARLIDAAVSANLTAIVVLSMALTPLAIIALRKFSPKMALSLEGVDEPNDLSGSVLLIGFGRFGQVVSQSLLARGVEVAIIDTDVEMIESAQTFGFKVYYGDGTRLDVLRASGAGNAQLIAICIDDRAAATVTAQLIRHEFPQARLLARSFDREHALELVHAGVDLQVRETFESAMRFGEAALVELGVSADDAAEVVADIRRRDAERFELELVGGVRAGVSLLYGNMQQTPLIAPKPRSKQPREDEEHAPGISA